MSPAFKMQNNSPSYTTTKSSQSLLEETHGNDVHPSIIIAIALGGDFHSHVTCHSLPFLLICATHVVQGRVPSHVANMFQEASEKKC